MAGWVFVAAHQLPLLEVNGGYALVVVCRLLFTVSSLVDEHRLQGTQASVAVACRLSSCGPWSLEHRLSSCGTRA